MGSVVVAHELGCSRACGIFLVQGLSPRSLLWHAGSYSLFEHISLKSESIQFYFGFSWSWIEIFPLPQLFST